MNDEPGSLRRALYGWRNTATVMAPLWLALTYLTAEILRGEEGMEDLAFVLLVFITFCFGVLLIIPVFALTVGRWLDRRTAPKGARHSAMIFGIYGLGFGIVLTMLLGIGALTPLGIAMLLLAPTISAVGGRLLLEVRGRVGGVVLWFVFVVAIVAALSLAITLIGSS